MDLQPLIEASLPVRLHVAAVLPAIILSPVLLLGRKGTPRHRLLGRIWLAAMVLTASTALLIHEIRLLGPFSPIHLLSVLTLSTCWVIIRSARAGRVAAHRSAVLSLVWLALVGAGAFTLVPGRIMHQVMLTPQGWVGAAILAVVATMLVVLAWHPASSPFRRPKGLA